MCETLSSSSCIDSKQRFYKAWGKAEKSKLQVPLNSQAKCASSITEKYVDSTAQLLYIFALLG